MSGTPLARPDAWRLWWSFTWRQAVVMLLLTAAMGVTLSLLKWAGVPSRHLFGATPYLTFGIVIYSGYEACRRLFGVYDIRLQEGGLSGEQNHHRGR